MLQGDFIWEEGDGADEDEFKMNLPKKISELPCGGIKHGTVLEIDDNSQNLSIQVAVTHKDVWEGDEVPDFPFTVGAIPPSTKREDTKPSGTTTQSSSDKATSALEASSKMIVEDDDDDVVLIVDDDDDGVNTNSAGKRSMDDANNEEKPAKKAKTTPSNDDGPSAEGDVEVIEIED
mmetsp:Transcript_858/g.1827  ORF Transcript_858/g.1827 Transcript_858/m.1827 type:complete len:177 (+) Transcript_858:328-858(+)